MAKKKLVIDLLPAIRKLEVLTKQHAESGLIGQYSSVFKGRGIEFEDYRTYSTTDDASLIDWKASKKANRILIKEYVEERNVNVVFALDVSESMLFGSTEKLKNEYAAELVASLAHAILEVGDNVGLVMYNDTIVENIVPSRKKSQFYDISRNLTNPELYGGNGKFSELSKFLLTSFNRGTVVIIVSDFVGMDEGWKSNLKIITSKFDVIGIIIRDPRDRTLPGDYVGEILIKDPYSHKRVVIDPSLLKDLYEKETRRQEEELLKSFVDAGADSTIISTDEFFVKPIVKLFKLRALKIRR
ncbi:DUF58 domain-containing protein [Candidatus Woesearchaeota archaeon]|nr:DUF58 domain-containing protein [Candidatus Woesearchaeota archaeon]